MKDIEYIKMDFVKQCLVSCFAWGIRKRKSIHDILTETLDRIDKLPKAEVAPVEHGYWFVSDYEYLNCSVCGDSMYTGCNSSIEANLLREHWKKYCPNCGARMDLEVQDG